MLVAGHLFITHGDVLGMACDAVLVPSGTMPDETGTLRFGFVTEGWRHSLGSALDGPFLRDPPDFKHRAVEVASGSGIQQPSVWAALAGDRGDEELGFFIAALEAFVDAAGASAWRQLHNGTPRPLRANRPLLALPLIGSGDGGARYDKGALLLETVDALVGLADRHDVDIALVLRDVATYAAAQQARSRLPVERCWSALSDEHHRYSEEIGHLARAGRLVLFFGAGASTGAGLPSWSELLDLLAVQAGLDNEQRRELAHLEHRDAGRVLDRRLRGSGGLGQAVASATQAQRCSLVHQLLASLPVTEAVTTNYDVLFEKAWRDTSRPLRVLPYDATVDDRPWLLKLHGSNEQPESIVLSRDDYLRFESEGVALAGIVQAMLLTRHMLFVGYSLSDENFHRLVHQVRTALGSVDQPADSEFGTAITPRSPSLGDDIWAGSIRFVTTEDEGGTEDPWRTAVLLDRIGASAAAPAAFVLDDSYSALFSDA